MIDEGEAHLRVCFSQGWLHGCRRWEEFDLKNADYHFKLEGITALLKKMDYHDVTIAIDGWYNFNVINLQKTGFD